MAIAVLELKSNNSDKVITLENANLRYIDSMTMSYKNQKDFLNSLTTNEKLLKLSSKEIENSTLTLTYVKNNMEKVALSILYDDNDDIRTRTSSLEEVKSEGERSRKLMLNSKNQIFLTLFLLNNNLLETTDKKIRMTIEEYKIAKKEGYKVEVIDGEYKINIKEVLRYRLNHKKLGPMRLLVEDTLEEWKKYLLSNSDEDLYFYSRELRLLLNEYDYRKIPRKVVYNLAINYDNLISNYHVKKNNNFHYYTTVGLSKRKILED